ncbi:MAG: Maf family protein [Pseudomonadota bacterium]
MEPQLILASRSPRRRELLAQVGLRFEVVDVDIDERPHPEEMPLDYVLRMAAEKARAGSAKVTRPRLPVLGADTAVVVDDRILGKPRDRDDALAQLAILSDRSHEVLSAIAIAEPAESLCVASTVTFRMLSSAEASAYCDTGEPFDKAGSYAIQGRAAMFVSHLDGSYSAVMGLPVHETCSMLARHGVRLWS